jgi:hypothetical protein
LILLVAINLSPIALGTAPISIGQALSFGSLECSFFDQNPLAFISLARSDEADHDRGKRAVLASAPGQRGVSPGQIDKMVKIGAGQAERAFAFHREKIAVQ